MRESISHSRKNGLKNTLLERCAYARRKIPTLKKGNRLFSRPNSCLKVILFSIYEREIGQVLSELSVSN